MKIKIVAKYLDHWQFYPMLKLEVQNLLKDKGIFFVEKNPDVILYHTYHADEKTKKEAFDSKLPIIILERFAGAGILLKEEILSDNVIAVLKSTIFRDFNNNLYDIDIDKFQYSQKRSINNYNYHRCLIHNFLYDNDKINDYKKNNLSLDLCSKKIKLWYNFASYQLMEPYIKSKNVIEKERDFDVGFIGTTEYKKQDMITQYRKYFFNIIKSFTKYKLDIKDHRISGKQNYINNILNCKIGLSPWGLGEKCYRDFEIIYGGGLLIKPDTSFVLDWIDTYNIENKYYISCNYDFSDLEEKISTVLDNWKDYTEFRISARQRLIDKCWNDESIANHIISTLESI